jgi:dihydroorotase (homodimeric type)
MTRSFEASEPEPYHHHHKSNFYHQRSDLTMTIEPQRITLDLPDDFHHHARDGSKTPAVLKHAVKRFGRCLFMPNLNPPVVNTEMALEYRKHILDSLPPNTELTPLMTLYLTDKTTPEEIRKAHATGMIVACKYYPAGATTNSDLGVSDVKHTYAALEAMQEIGMRLCIHSEVTNADIFEREPVFIEEVMKPLVAKFPTLNIIMEHISTAEAVNYVMNESPDNVRASITCHHLLFNRNRKYLLIYSTLSYLFSDIIAHSCLPPRRNRHVGRRHSPTFVLLAYFEVRKASLIPSQGSH